MNFLFLAVFLALFSFISAQKRFLTSIQAGNKAIGLYFTHQDPETSQTYENLLQIVQPNEVVNELNPDNTSFIVRSSDLETRVRVEFVNHSEDPERPYGIIFTNLAHFDRGGAKPVELKHGDSGFIWIEPTHNVAHVTSSNIPFELRDADKNLICSFTIFDHNEEL